MSKKNDTIQDQKEPKVDIEKEEAEISPEPTEEDKVQELGEKLNELNDKYLRLYSEYENYRKRTTMEKADLLINGSKEMMKAILPIVDDLERALAAMTDDEGVRLIYNKMMKILEQKGLKAMETQDVKFNGVVAHPLFYLEVPVGAKA